MDPLSVITAQNQPQANSQVPFANLTPGLPVLENLANRSFNEFENAGDPSLNEKTVHPILSEFGIPQINNVAKLQQLYSAAKKPGSEKKTFLDEALELPHIHTRDYTVEEIRKITMDQVRAILKEKLVSIEQLDRLFDHPNTLDFLTKLGLLNPSAATLLLVHLVLWGKSILRLGTEKHWKAYLEKSNNLEIMGCCLMTEMGHGSNVPGLETTATYDPNTREFIIHTPTRTANKAFIGGAAQNATHGILFANLILNAQPMGVHAFIVPLRANSQTLPGITIQDMGAKRGLNGVDNGFVAFNQVRIPYDNFLDHFAEISDDGIYIPKNGNKDPQTLIYFLLCQLNTGRQTIAWNSASSLPFLTSLFCCYPPSIGITFHKKLMVKFLSRAFALKFAQPIYLGNNIEDHVPASLMKAVSSEMAMAFFQELLFYYGCNPQANRVYTLIKKFAHDFDATLTYEGDNMVLLQMVTKYIFKNIYNEDQDAPPEQDPYHLLQREVFNLASEIGKKLETSGGDVDKGLEIWNQECQLEGIKMAEIYGQKSILKEFYKKACALDAEQNTTKWSKLYFIYAYETCSKYLTLPKTPDLAAIYNELYPDIYGLLIHFDLKMEWLYAMLPPPTHSIPFETFATSPKQLLSKLQFNNKL